MPVFGRIQLLFRYYINYDHVSAIIREMFNEEAKNAFHKRTHDFCILMRNSITNIKIYNGN